MLDNKPCPFCGCKTPRLSSRIVVESGAIQTLFRVQCSECRTSTAEYATNYEAIMAWNRRADDENGVRPKQSH